MSKAEAMEKWIEQQQEEAWFRLWHQLETAANGYWSIGAASALDTILESADFVGWISWVRVNPRILEAGIYQAVLTHYGVPFPDQAITDWVVQRMQDEGRTEELAGRLSKHYLRHHSVIHHLIDYQSHTTSA